MKQLKIYSLATLLTCSVLLQACSGGDADQSAAEAVKPEVFIVSPANGTKVSSPVTIEFGIRGYTLAPAGTQDEGTGHHHLLIDVPAPDLSLPIPADENHLHFGKAQTSATVELAPGEHTL
ncbi:MAG: DUF4399 domain-containing protein, partial [Gammaproteobacteria bacterium]